MADRKRESVSDEMIRQARSRNLIDYLISLGHAPATQVKGSKAMFRSPLRVDRNPSFSVCERHGAWVWYDFGTKEHGDVIAFAMQYHGWTFAEAVAHLAGACPVRSRRPPSPPQPVEPDQSVTGKIEEVRALYRQTKLAQTAEDQAAIVAYFTERYRLPVYPELNAVVLRWKETRYLAIPIPNLKHLRGLECRALQPDQTPETWRRITLGRKTLWVLQRGSPAVLVTESVVDTLAGDRLYPDWRFTLVALNGIANWDKLEGLMEQIKPKAVWLALDNDADVSKGPATERLIADRLTSKGIDVRYVRQHYAYGVKDLGALWRRLAEAKEPCARAAS
ncbi:MAG: CHC2 zinc finger domain-containing protein [Nitrospirota bacterium]